MFLLRGYSWGTEHNLWCKIAAPALWGDRAGFTCVVVKNCHVTKWPFQENVVPAQLGKINKTKTWWSPELITLYDVERLKIVVRLNSRWLDIFRPFEVYFGIGNREHFKLQCEKMSKTKYTVDNHDREAGLPSCLLNCL